MRPEDQIGDLAKTRHRQVWDLLATVMDPELDEPVTELRFVTHVDVGADGRVRLGFRLPTYWCAANFSYLMADDMRRAVAALDWVRDVEVTLGEHMYAEKINRGLAKGLSFRETFGDEANGDIEGIRRTFLVKAFQRRQAAMLAYLADAGSGPEALVESTIGELQALALDGEGVRLRRRYLDRREVAGAMQPAAPAFVSSEGSKLNAEALAKYRSGLRRIGVSAEFNGELCRGLLAVRFDLETPLRSCRPPAPDFPGQQVRV
jgi:metal-sulfur cluster biosynthetic enzyme